MGSDQSKTEQMLKYVETDWQNIGTQQDLFIVRNKKTGKEGQIMTVIHDPRREVGKQLQIYDYRRTQDHALIAVYAVHHKKSENQLTLCGNLQTFKVVVERIPILLREIQALSFQEGLYVLSQSLRGFDDLYGKVGQFEITDQMVGFNISGNTKVWFNDNFVQNHPPMEKPILQVTAAEIFQLTHQKQEAAMMQRVVELLHRKVKDGFPEEFMLLMKKQRDFINAYQSIQMYCYDHNLYIPDCLTFTDDFFKKNKINHIFQVVTNRVKQTPRRISGQIINLGARNTQNKKFNVFQSRNQNRLNEIETLKRQKSLSVMSGQSVISGLSFCSNNRVLPPVVFTYFDRQRI